MATYKFKFPTMDVQYTDDPDHGSDFMSTGIHIEFEADNWAAAKAKIQTLFPDTTTTVTNDPTTSA